MACSGVNFTFHYYLYHNGVKKEVFVLRLALPLSYALRSLGLTCCRKEETILHFVRPLFHTSEQQSLLFGFQDWWWILWSQNM